MFIIIHCLGMPFNGDTVKKGSLGGSESAAYYLAKDLSKKGHRVTVFTNSAEEGVFDGVNYMFAGMQTERTPLGERFHIYGSGTPSDVMIIQRHPQAFKFPWASKINLWWVHDLAIIRQRELVRSQLWNVTGILTVSQYHKDQICKVYDINPEVVRPIQNGVDLSLFEGECNIVDTDHDQGGGTACGQIAIDDGVKLLYTSRPERGLEHLVEPNGIMEKLAKIDSKYHLYVCNYENTTEQMKPYYDYLYGRIEKLPNVTMLGHLTKQELADVMRQCDAMVYPTPSLQAPEFNEVSCITAMECMAAGLPFISSNRGALPETCKDSGSILLDGDKDGMPSISKFVKIISSRLKGAELQASKNAQLEAAKKYDWSVAGDMTLDIVKKLFELNRSNGGVLRSLIRNSDIYAAEKLNSKIINPDYAIKSDAISKGCNKELGTNYKFAWEDAWNEHYQKYYEYEKNRGVDYGAESLDRNDRFEYVSGLIGDLPDGSAILDYGCAHGHYTINLAKRFPKLKFTGVDITKSNIEKAEKWAKDDGVENAEFINSFVSPDGNVYLNEGETVYNIGEFDAIIAAEVVEHVESAQHIVDSLAKLLKEKGQMIITTPFGAWEAQGYKEHWPWRAHVHHFEREDLHNMFSHNDNFKVVIVACGNSKWGLPLGSYITTFSKGKENIISKEIDYDRKLRQVAPIQTVSACLIVHNAEDTLIRCLRSIEDCVDEVIIGIDEKTDDRTMQVIENYIKDQKSLWPVVSFKEIKSPMSIGFDEARNETIKDAKGDWILWLDDDEELIGGQNIFKYLHNNAYHGYSLKQHHFTIEPLGVMKTDLPCRLFRNRRGVKFYGVVHEHPELIMNEGVGHVQLIQDVEIAHNGYTTEAIRRGRFHRNLDLLERDRQKYPDRVLGKFLWMRDLSQMCKYEFEMNGHQITEEMHKRADAGIKLWEELLDDNHLRMLVDGMEFYSTLSHIKGTGFEFGFTLDSSKMNGGLHMERALPITGFFHCREHIDKLMNAITNEKVKDYDSKYF